MGHLPGTNGTRSTSSQGAAIDAWDPGTLRWGPPTRGIPVETPSVAARRERRFMPRIPERDYCRATAGGGAAAVVYTILVQRCLLERSARVTLTSTTLARFCVSRGQKERALLALEQAGLVTVERTNGKNPVVTVLTEAAKRRAGRATVAEGHD